MTTTFDPAAWVARADLVGHGPAVVFQEDGRATLHTHEAFLRGPREERDEVRRLLLEPGHTGQIIDHLIAVGRFMDTTGTAHREYLQRMALPAGDVS